jgi:hypothetical protein
VLTVFLFLVDLSNSSLAFIEHSSENLTTSKPQTVGLIDPTAPPKPPFVKPAGFRENSEFFGMERELIELDDKVFDPGVRAKGTACVLLWCLPGGGKSYVAREYVYKNRQKFPGGIFWVQAKSKSEIWQGFWDIAEQIALKDLKDPRTLRFEEEKAAFVEAIKDWFQKRHDWLLLISRNLSQIASTAPSSSLLSIDSWPKSTDYFLLQLFMSNPFEKTRQWPCSATN